MQNMCLLQRQDDRIREEGKRLNILITGANGMLGEAVIETFKNDNIFDTDIDSMDIRYWQEVAKYVEKPINLIIHLAAETNLEKCESSPTHAYMTNVTGTANMTELARIRNIPIVYISTAGIFDGEKAMYIDTDIPNPLNHYGRSKLYGEYIVKGHYKHYIFRAGYMMGGGRARDKKFVSKIIKQIEEGRDEIYALKNVYGSPTYTWDLAETIKTVVNRKLLYDTYNCAGLGVASRLDVARTIADVMKSKAKIIPVKHGYFKESFPCERSRCEVLDNLKLKARGINTMRHWKESLTEYVTRYYL